METNINKLSNIVKTIELNTTDIKEEFIIDCGDTNWCAIEKVLGVTINRFNNTIFAKIHLSVLVEDWGANGKMAKPKPRNKFYIKSYKDGEPLPNAGEVFLFNDFSKHFFGNF